MTFPNYLKNISEELNFTFGVQSIHETKKSMNPTDLDPQLTELEIIIFNSFKIDKRKEEWLAGRYAAKIAYYYFCKKFKRNLTENITILNGENKAPYILEHPELELSISHSYEYAIAVISISKIGVDLEKIIPHYSSITKYFFSVTESNAITKESEMNNKPDEVITKYWTRKEAVAKYLKLGMKINFKLLDTTSDYISILNSSNKVVKLVSHKINDYYLSIAI